MAKTLLRAILVFAAVSFCHGSRVSAALSLGTQDNDPSLPIADASHLNKDWDWSMRNEVRAKFDSWAQTHEKEYSGAVLGGHSEYGHRLNIFERNFHFVHRLIEMKANDTWDLSAEGPFMDLEAHEFNNRLGYKREGGDLSEDDILSDAEAFSDFKYKDAEMKTTDWREKGAVTGVKDQGQCGSCWSFSTTGVLEGINAVNTGDLVSLSEQELVACDTAHIDQGCGGGEMTVAYKWIQENGGLVPEQDYPYVSGAGTSPGCDSSKLNDESKVTLSGFSKLPVGKETALQQSLMYHPISIAVNANQWQFYGGGVFKGLFGFCGPVLNHGVLAVGYNVEEEYYIVKNSWGKVWGEQGYIKVKANTRSKVGLCGITMDASFPTQDTDSP